MRFFGAADQHSLYFLATWCKGGVQGSELLTSSTVMRVTEEDQASGLNSKMVAGPELATCGVLSAAQIRPPARCAAQHPGIERRAIMPAAFSIPLRNSPLAHRLPATTHGPLAPTATRKSRAV
jgi:hypothetical protein